MMGLVAHRSIPSHSPARFQSLTGSATSPITLLNMIVMPIVNLKTVCSHRFCPKVRQNLHRCYTQEQAEAVADDYNFGLYMPLFSSWHCKGPCKGKCWHVGHDRMMQRDYENAVIAEVARDSAASLYERTLTIGRHSISVRIR